MVEIKELADRELEWVKRGEPERPSKPLKMGLTDANTARQPL